MTLYNLVNKLFHIIRHYKYRTRVRALITRGLVLGKNVTIAETAVIDASYPYLIRIGSNCSIADQVRIWAHDAATFKFTGGHARLGKVDIKDNCFIGDRATILPGVTIGPNVLVTAGSVVNRDVPSNSCVAGVPARVYGKFDEFIERNRTHIQGGCVFEYADLIGHLDHLDKGLQTRIVEATEDGGYAYVRGNSGRDPFTWNVD